MYKGLERPREGPPERWINGIKKAIRTNYQQVVVTDRSEWKRIREACNRALYPQVNKTGRKRRIFLKLTVLMWMTACSLITKNIDNFRNQSLSQ